jgi:hypothetical protein
VLVVAFTIAALDVAAFPRTARAEVPWATGVAKDRQSKANALFAEGNQLFAQQAHAPALDKYKQAIELWDHPLIEFNMAVTLVRLDRILEAAETIDKALRFGQAPFPSPEQYQQALDYQKLVAGRVGTIAASCEQTSGAVLLDGRPWFSCPGTHTVRVLAGEHVVVAEAAGFMTRTRRLVIAGGATVTEAIALVPIDKMLTLEYPSPRWLPWTVTGTGLAIALGGVAFWVAGTQQMEQFHDDADELCRPDGCSVDLDASATERQLAAQRDSAELKGVIAAAMLGVGGAITAGGIVWTVINRPKRVLPTVEVTPTSGGATAAIGWQF